MADAKTAIAELLGEGLRPIAEQLARGAAEQRSFLVLLGYSVPSPPPALATLPLAVTPLVDALVELEASREAMDAADDTALESEVDTALEHVFLGAVAVAAAVKTVGVTAAAELPDFESRFYEHLFVSSVFEQRPVLFAALAALGLLEVTDQQVDLDGTTAVVPRFTFHGARVEKLLTDPSGLLQEVYSFGTPHIDTELLFDNLARLTTLLGVPAAVEFPTAEMAAAYGVATPADLSDLQRQLVIPIGSALDDAVTFALGIYAVPGATPADAESLAITLEVEGETTIPIQLTPSALLEIEVKGAVSSGLGILLRPNQPPTLLANVLGDGGAGELASASAELRLTFTDATEPPLPEAPGMEILSVGDAAFLRADKIQLTAVARVGTGSAPDVLFGFAIDGGRAVLAAGEGDGLLATFLPKEPMEARFDAGIQWSRSTGVHFEVAGGLEKVITLNEALGPFVLGAVRLAVNLKDKLGLDFSVDGSAKLGPVALSVEGVGGRLLLKFERGNLGIFDATAGFLAPKGLGIAVNSGPVHGGGFISFDPDAGRYSGALELSIYGISVKAFGLIETKVPGVDFSFIIVISAEFTAIQLGFGFTLNGVGGLVGINRTVDSTALANLVRAGQSEELLFPKNLIQNAPTIIRDLGSVFPARQGHYVFGPLAKLGWGTPTLITGEIGIILEIPGPVIVLLGEVKCLLPKPDAALVKINLSIGGTLDFPNKKLSLDAMLHDSIIQGYPISGQMALRVAWGEQPNFALSIGGFHPAYQPPKDFPKLQPMALDLGQHGSASITVSGFFAVTSNTVQVGGDARLHAGGSGISLDASVSVKALFVFSPFHFQANIDASVKISFHGHGPSVHLSALLEGPSPWHIRGEVCVSILFWDACLGFNETFGGGAAQPTVPELDPWIGVERPPPGSDKIIGLKTALQDAGNWSGVLPSGTANVVSRAQGSEALVDPLGGLSVHQKAVPVETDQPISRFGVAKVASPIPYVLKTASFGSGVTLNKLSANKDFFAPAQYFQMDDGKKLSSAGFEQRQSGYVFGENANNVRAGSNAPKTLTYSTFLIAGDGTISPAPDPSFTATNDHVTGLNKRSAVALGGASQSGTRRFIDRLVTQAFQVNQLTFGLSSTSALTTLAESVGGIKATTRSAALLALDAFRTQNPAQRLQVQVSAIHELA